MNTSFIRQRLLTMRDEKNAAFQAKLTPPVDPDTILGIRLPALKQFAKDLAGLPEAEAFLSELPHRYFDENNLHAFLLMRIQNFDRCMERVEAFLPYLNNWATCDSLRPPCFRKDLPELHVKSTEWMQSDHVYTVRFGIGMRLSHFLDEAFDPTDLWEVAAVTGEDYYIRMMVAWYFATALAKQYDATIPYLEKHLLDDWTHRKTIQKAIESYRITDKQKTYLKTLRSISV